MTESRTICLAGRTALVTGAGRGIGAAIALELAQAGAAVVALDLDAPGATHTARRIGDAGGCATALHADIRDVHRCGEVARTAAQLTGTIDILVNSAGIGDGLAFEAVTHASFDAVFAVNVRGLFFLTQAVVPEMKARGFGRLISIGSLIAARGAAGNPHYAGAKAALFGFTRSWAVELAPHGITANLIVPGLMPTPMTTSTTAPEELERRAQQVPAGRLGRPSDVAALTVYLASDAAGFLTGQAMSPNGAEFVGAL